MNQHIFYHYTRFIDEIKKRKKLLAGSFPNTNTYDMVLDFCPEVILNRAEIDRLNDYREKHEELIKNFRRKCWVDDISYRSAYRNIKLRHKSPLLDTFINGKWYILAFSELFEKGWINDIEHDHKSSGIFDKIGNKFVKFRVTKNQIKKSFVLEQKHFLGWHIDGKFGKARPWKKYIDVFYRDLKELDTEGKNYMNYFTKYTFGRYYRSIKKLEDYKKGEFYAPEFWIYGDVPISRCEFGEVNICLFKKMTGYGSKEIKKYSLGRSDYTERQKHHNKQHEIEK